jgi:ribonuclease HI
MAAFADEDVLRFIAREEPLTATLRAFPGLSREQLTRLLERHLPVPPAAPQAPSPARAQARASAPAGPHPAELRALRVYSDGAARGNPGPAGAGAVLMDTSGQVVERLGRYLGVQTNNYAEYTALLLGIERARELGAREVEVFADSELRIRQLAGPYQVKSPTLRPLFEQAQALLRSFARVKLVHVPREMNAEADAMSNRAIDVRMS